MSSSVASNNVFAVWIDNTTPWLRICSDFSLANSKFFLAKDKASSASLNLFSASCKLRRILSFLDVIISPN